VRFYFSYLTCSDTLGIAALFSLTIVAFFGIALLAWLASAQLSSGGRVGQAPDSAEPAVTTKIDVNRASLEEICRLPGIVRSIGQKIIKYRPYRRLDDLVTRRILSKKQFARIREYVSVGTGP
jgi:DNA uptake protein ComE-like DNA-binding protein